MLLDLLDHVLALSRAAPILILGTARLELLEQRADWGASRRGGTNLRLEPLAPTECVTLLDALGDPLSPEVRALAIRTSEGNPLFLQELVELARERGTVVVPPTIQALLAARLERLITWERELLERGSIEGEVFHRATLRVLASQQSEDELASRLASLVGKDLIRPHPPTGWGEDPFRFRHLLIRDAAYERLSKAVRAELHQRFAGWLEQVGAGLFELDEIAGWHLEQSVRYLQDLGRAVEPELKHRAAIHLHVAGQRAGARSDASAARNLLERALALTDPSQPLHGVIGIDLAERLIEAGELAQADELLTEAEGGATPDHAGALLNRLEWRVLAQPDRAAAAVQSMLPSMLDELARTGDNRRMAKAHMLAFWVHWAANQAVPASRASRLAADHAGAAGDSGLRSRALGWHIVTIIYGPLHVDVIQQELEAIEREDPGPYLAACLDLGRGEVERLHGRLTTAHHLTNRARDGFAALGMQPMAAGCAQELAQIELAKGDRSAARALLGQCDAVLAQLGERPQRSTTQAMLARVHELLGARGEALAAVQLAEELSSPEDAINFALTHAVRARLALANGDSASAERWARGAVEQALRTDFIVVHAEARLELARVLQAVGQPEHARSEGEQALSLFSAKGHRLGADAAGSLLERL
jgi:predicted ATPase